MFVDLFELDHVFEMLDEDSNCPPDINLRWRVGENSFLVRCADQLLSAVAEVERKHGCPEGKSYQSEILVTLGGVLRDCDSSLQLRAALVDLKLLLLKAMIIAGDLKSDSLIPLASRGKPFVEHPPKGLDKLSRELFEILKTHGKNTSMKMVWGHLRDLAANKHRVIQEVTAESVWWKSPNGEKETPYVFVQNRLTNLRKKI